MIRIAGRTGLRAIGAAVVGFVALIVASATPSAAATYTLNFTGTVFSAYTNLSIGAGDKVSGSVSFTPFNTSVDTGVPGVHDFAQLASSFTFRVEHLGSTIFDHTETGFGGDVRTESFAGNFSAIGISANSTDGTLSLDFSKELGSNPAVTDLGGFPTTAAGLLALLDGIHPQATGTYVLNTLGQVNFDLDLSVAPVAATPVPATLPLFVSALGGLGFVGWKRRRAVSH